MAQRHRMEWAGSSESQSRGSASTNTAEDRWVGARSLLCIPMRIWLWRSCATSRGTLTGGPARKCKQWRKRFRRGRRNGRARLAFACGPDRKSGDKSPHSKKEGGIKPPLQERTASEGGNYKKGHAWRVPRTKIAKGAQTSLEMWTWIWAVTSRKTLRVTGKSPRVLSGSGRGACGCWTAKAF